MNKNQIRAARALLAKHGLQDDKEQIVLEHTNGRTSSLTEMNYQETKSFFSALSDNYREPKSTPEGVEASRMKLYALCHENGWETKDGKVDYDRLDEWCIKYTPAHKQHREQNQAEISKTIAIYSKMYVQNLSSL